MHYIKESVLGIYNVFYSDIGTKKKKKKTNLIEFTDNIKLGSISNAREV